MPITLAIPAIFGGVLAVAGITAWTVQLRRGLAVTSLSNLRPWGSYITGFIFFMGLAGGSLILAAFPILFDHKAMREYSVIAAVVALAALIVAGLFIFVDIGKPSRVWRMVSRPNFRSPMIWDLLLTVAYFVISVVLLITLVADATPGILIPVAVIALVAGIADGVTALVFSTVIARSSWYSAIQPVAFVAAAIASSGAFLILLVLSLATADIDRISVRGIGPLAAVTASALVLGVLLLASEAISTAFSRTTKSRKLLRAMLGSSIFWVEIATSIAAVAILTLAAAAASGIWLAIGSFLALLHLTLKRIHFVHLGFAVPNIEYKGIDIDRGRGGGTKPVELALSAGLVGGFILLVSIGLWSLQLT